MSITTDNTMVGDTIEEGGALDSDALVYNIADELDNLANDKPLMVRLREGFTGDPVWLDFKFAMRASFINKMKYDRSLRDPTPFQMDIADYLQYGNDALDANEMIRYWSIVQACRGLGKTFITTMFVAWLLSLDPTIKIMIVSKNKDFSMQLLQQIREEINTNPIYAHLVPGADSPRDNASAFYVSGALYDKDPSVSAWSIEGKLQGMRADVIIGDDVESTQNSATRAMQDKLAYNVKEFINILKPGGMIVMLGTPQINNTLYHRLIRNGYNVRIWPALFPTAEQMQRPTYGPYLAPLVKDAWTPQKVGQVADPKRFSLKNLMDKKLGVSGGEGSGVSAFELQYMLDPSIADSDRFPLKTEELIAYSPILVDEGPTPRYKVPIKLEYSNHAQFALKTDAGYTLYEPFVMSKEFTYLDEVIMSIDPAASTGDELGYAVLGRQGGTIFALEVGGIFNGTSPQALERLAKIAKAHGATTIVPEKNFGAGMFGRLLRPVLDVHHPCHLVEDFSVSGQKEVRIIRTLEPLINAHRLVVSKQVVLNDGSGDYSLLGQLSSITYARNSLIHDDRLDAVAIGCKYLQDRISFDIDMYNEQMVKDMAVKAYREAQALKEARKAQFHISDWTEHAGYEM